MKKIFIIFIVAVVLATGITLYQSSKQEALPPAQNRDSFNPSPSPTPTPNVNLPAEINLAVPFTSQAPHANWEDPYGEFCEEASVLMAAYYLQNKTIPSADFADAELLKIKAFEENKFGYYKDTTAAETEKILNEYFDVSQTKLLYSPTIDQIKQAVSQGKLVIVPAAGRLLPNPNFRSPGPLYHMLVVKGYTADGEFITNDPGTRKGADFIYKFDDLMNTIHDWNGGDVYNGNRVVIVVG